MNFPIDFSFQIDFITQSVGVLMEIKTFYIAGEYTITKKLIYL